MPEFIPQLLRFASLPSTNLEAARLAGEGAPEGLCIIAGEQTAGRGRLQRQWVSPKGAGLYFSIILRPQFAQITWPLLTLMAAVAVHDTLLEACACETDIKWPNDLLFREKKLCGILAETVETPTGRAVVVGIGINLTARSVPPDLVGVATSVADATGKSAELEVILAALTCKLATHYSRLQGPDGPQRVVDAWCARSSYAAGKRIRVSESELDFSGVTRGLEPDGALRIETDGREIKIVRTGDVTSIRSAG